MDDLLDILNALQESENATQRIGRRDAEYAAVDNAADWMVQHLHFTVPWCIARLAHTARHSHLDHGQAITAELSRQGRELGGMAGGTEPQQSIASIIGAFGDSLMGGSRPGRGAAVAMAMAWGLAAVALQCDDGATFRHLHWCHPSGCSCTAGQVSG